MKKIGILLGSFLILLLFFNKDGWSQTTSKKKKKSKPPVEQVAAVPTPPSPGDTVSPGAPVTWHEKFEAGWRKGLYFQTKDKKYSLRFRGRIQPRLTYNQLSNKKVDNPDSVGFQIRRAQLNWQGNVFSKNLDYNVQINAAASRVDDILEDAWLDYRFYNPLRIQIGQFPVPYIRQFVTSAGRLQFVDRSIAAEDFRFSTWDTSTTQNCTIAGTAAICPANPAVATTIRRFRYDVGLMVHGDAWDNKFEYYAGVFNGTGFNRLNPNADLLYLGRVVWNPVGQYGYQESDLNYSKTPAITVGASGGYLKQNINPVNTKLTQAGLELGAKYRGFSLQSELFYRNNNPAGVKDYDDLGYYAQAGYLFKEKFEIAGRVSQEFLGGQGTGSSPRNANAPGAKPNNKGEYTAAFSYYIFQHDLKVQADYSYLTTQTDQSYGTLGDQRVRLQMQAWF